MIKKSIGIMILLMALSACSEHPEEKQAIEKARADQEQAASGLTFSDMPNEQTTYATIETDSTDENEALLLALETRLLKANFEFIEKDSGSSWSENDCTLNKVIQVKGGGIRSYKAVSKEKLGDDQQYRPDFVLLVFSFKDEQTAEQSFKMLESAVNSAGGYCNGKSPENIVRNGNEIFYFTTRAEMFRTYIDDYAKFIHEFKLEQTNSNGNAI
ncbi:MAG: hypothetical protein GAK29_04711 [Acinetobacter bereziniae]|uniref:Lipoprotein n=1 Tax=Acinetobacter bereziniae TaxID=106648 RepID=A0A833PB17_ACIBZ|nr:MAG: hypothetical protein GAK29_04711 [Acinetobacter bereziniae]